MELIVLIHGLMRTKWSMKKLERSFKKSGHDTLNVSYASLIHPIPKVALELLPKLIYKKLNQKKSPNAYTKIHFVTHSLGGIIARYYFSHAKNLIPGTELGRIVMIAPPNNGSELAEKWRKHFWFKLSQGPAGQSLGRGRHSIVHKLKPLNNEVGIIAGNRPKNIFTAALLPSENDGTVTVESTKLMEMKDHLILPYDHTFIMNKKQTKEQVHYFLKYGQFRK